MYFVFVLNNQVLRYLHSFKCNFIKFNTSELCLEVLIRLLNGSIVDNNLFNMSFYTTILCSNKHEIAYAVILLNKKDNSL